MEQAEQDWSNLEQNIKIAMIAAIGAVLLGLTSLLGMQFLYIAIACGAGGIYIAFPEKLSEWTDHLQVWVENHSPEFLGAGIGLLLCPVAPPLGMVVGAALGHFFYVKYLQVTETASNAAKVAQAIMSPVVHPLQTLQNIYSAAEEAFAPAPIVEPSSEIEEELEEPRRGWFNRAIACFTPQVEEEFRGYLSYPKPTF